MIYRTCTGEPNNEHRPRLVKEGDRCPVCLRFGDESSLVMPIRERILTIARELEVGARRFEQAQDAAEHAVKALYELSEICEEPHERPAA